MKKRLVYNINILVIVWINEDIKELSEVEKVVLFALNYQKITNAVFNIIIVDKNTIQKLNREYRNKDSVTDVISFALEDDNTFIKTDLRVLGDIYICLDRAKEQASEYGHSLLRELSFLSVHGLLHLLGYDHQTKEDENVMFGLQELILNEYGIKR